MSDVSPSRRRLGRWLLAGGALTLPLTASISYAAAAQDSVVESVDVDASEAPSAPQAPVAPEAPQAPEAPRAPDAPRIERHVYKIHREGDHADKGEHRMFVMRDGAFSDAQRKHFEEMSREWAKKGAEWQAKSGEWEKMAKQHRQMALAMAEHMPVVSTDCDKAGGSASRSWTDDSGRQHVVICERIIREQARMAQGQASVGLRMAREAIAHNAEISASVRDQVLAELDQEIVRLEAQK
jgi:hypothetical protein